MTHLGAWCNGNTAVSNPATAGSIPAAPVSTWKGRIMKRKIKRWLAIFRLWRRSKRMRIER